MLAATAIESVGTVIGMAWLTRNPKEMAMCTPIPWAFSVRG